MNDRGYHLWLSTMTIMRLTLQPFASKPLTYKITLWVTLLNEWLRESILTQDNFDKIQLWAKKLHREPKKTQTTQRNVIRSNTPKRLKNIHQPTTEDLRYLLTFNFVRPQIPLRPSSNLLLAPLLASRPLGYIYILLYNILFF